MEYKILFKSKRQWTEGKSSRGKLLKFFIFPSGLWGKIYIEITNKHKSCKRRLIHCSKKHTILYKLGSLRDELFTFIDAINNCVMFLYFLVCNNNKNWMVRIVGRKQNVSIIFCWFIVSFIFIDGCSVIENERFSNW